MLNKISDSHCYGHAVQWSKFLVVAQETGFLTEFGRSSTRSISFVSQAILESVNCENGRLLLLVDEVGRSGESQDISSAIEDVLNHHENFDAILSALETQAIQPRESSSGRWMEWVQLPPISDKNALQLFEFEAAFKDIFSKRTTQLTIPLARGHPRTLTNIWRVLREYQVRSVRFPSPFCHVCLTFHCDC